MHYALGSSLLESLEAVRNSVAAGTQKAAGQEHPILGEMAGTARVTGSAAAGQQSCHYQEHTILGEIAGTARVTGSASAGQQSCHYQEHPSLGEIAGTVQQSCHYQEHLSLGEMAETARATRSGDVQPQPWKHNLQRVGFLCKKAPASGVAAMPLSQPDLKLAASAWPAGVAQCLLGAPSHHATGIQDCSPDLCYPPSGGIDSGPLLTIPVVGAASAGESCHSRAVHHCNRCCLLPIRRQRSAVTAMA